jgi:adenine-specific DNA-methyltransferase
VASSPRSQISGLKFRRQHPFGDFILDFVCLENKLVIEVDGGQHGQQAGYDENRTQKLQAAGFRVLRFWNNEVLKEIDSVKEKIGLVVQEPQSHPPPNLPLEGGGIKKFPVEGREVRKSFGRFPPLQGEVQKVVQTFPSPSKGGRRWGWGCVGIR